MAILDLNLKEMELMLRLYLDRCDKKPLYWWYYNDGRGTQIKAIHQGEIIDITLLDLTDFFFNVWDKTNLH